MKTGWPKGLTALLLYSACWSAPAVAARVPFSSEDWWQWREMGDPRISADGARVVYAERYPDRAADAIRCNLWTVATKGGGKHALTAGAWCDWEPRWSSDGTKVAYFSDRAGKPQIFVSLVNGQGGEGGTARQVTQLEAPPLTLAWSPDGNSIAFTARVEMPAGAAAWAPRAVLPWLRQGPAVLEKLFLIPIAGGPANANANPNATVRALPVGELEVRGEPAWMPDGQSLLIAAAVPPDAARALEGSEIFSVRVADGAVKQITRHAGPDENPVPSPDGSRIAWIAREAKAQSYVTAKLYVANPDGSRDKVLAGSLDRDVVQPQWSSDSRTVYFLADDRGATHVYAARNDGSVRPVTDGRERLRGFSLADNGRAVAVRSTAAAAAELVTFTVDLPGKAETLAAENEALLGDREIGTGEEIQYTSGPKTIQGWMVKPPGFDPARKYPLLLDLEDDPRRMCGGEFRLRAQVFAAGSAAGGGSPGRGMVVLCLNPRGTPGYGEEFGNLIRSRYPGDDFDDLQAGVDAVVAKGYIDTARIGIAGGLLAAWAIGHTARFHAAVARNPVADWAQEVASRVDGLYRAAAWMGAMPWDDPEQYTKHSPFYFAGNFRTPTLVIAAGASAGAEELYFALEARHVDSAIVRFPADGRPSRTALEWETVLAWLAR